MPRFGQKISETPLKLTAIRLHPHLLSKARRLCDRENITFSALVRSALSERLGIKATEEL